MTYEPHPLDSTSYGHGPSAELQEDARYLQANLPSLDAKDLEFARSLLESYEGPRGCSSKQAHWIGVLAQRVREKADAPAKVQIDLTRINQMIDRAAKKLKHPKLLVRDAETGAIYRVTPAGPGSRYYGQLNVTSTGSYEDRTWYGRLDQQGVFHASPQARETFTAIERALNALAQDPAGVAKAYGQATGVCCFCGITLTDERSVSAGYGPICAENFGLAWGDVDKRKVKSVSEEQALAALDFGKVEERVVAHYAAAPPAEKLAVWETTPSGTQVSANAHLDQSFDELLGAFEDAVQRIEREVGCGYTPDVEEEAKVAYTLAKRNLQSWVAVRAR